MMYGNQWGWGAMMWMPVIWVVLVGIIVWVIYRVSQTTSDDDPAAARAKSGREGPQEILDRRFASGEVDVETYTQMRDRLAGRAPGSS